MNNETFLKFDQANERGDEALHTFQKNYVPNH